MTLRWIRNPAACLVLAGLAALCCAVFVRPVALTAFAAILIVLLLGFCWPWLAIRGIACELAFLSLRAHEGEPVAVRLRITNRWPWPVWGLTLERGFERASDSRIEGERAALSLGRLPAWSASEITWQFVPSCRGEYPLETPRIATGFPFGLWRCGRDVLVEARLLVWPRIVPLSSLIDAPDDQPAHDRLSDKRVGDAGDLLGTRSFRNGDSLRRVHWAQTARHGRLIVCERQAAARSAVRVVFDPHAAAHDGIGADGSLEWTIRIVASVCRLYHARNAAVECSLGREVVPLALGPAGFRRFLDVLARIPPGGLDQPSVGVAPRTRRPPRSFEIAVVTENGLGEWPQLPQASGSRRVILVRTGSGGSAAADRQADRLSSRPWIVLDDRQTLAEEFRRQWRRNCHAI